MGNGARKALQRALGKGPLRPPQIAVLAFSSVLLVGGVAVFAVVGMPYLQQEWARAHGVSVGSVLLNADERHDAEEGSGVAEADNASPSERNGAEASKNGGPSAQAATGGSGNVSFPSLSALDRVVESKASSTESSISSGSASDGGASGDAGAGSDGGVSGDAPSGGDSPESAAPAEEQEMEWLAYLRGKYDALAPFQQMAAQCYAEYPTLALEPSHDARFEYFASVVNSRDQVAIAHMDMEENALPENSRYFAAYQNIKTLYLDLDSALSILARGWAINVQFDDPAAYEEAWMSPIYENTVNGKLTFFADYEARYPGARP